MPRFPLDSLTERRFRSGRPCLDFVHTGGVGRWTPYELIHDAADLDRWLGYVLDLPAVRCRAADVAATRELREAIWQLTRSQLGGRRLRPADLAVVNAAAARPPVARRLLGSGRSEVEPPTAAAALSSLARDAVDLFGGPSVDRVRACAAEDCELLFFDSSRPGRRRWCSMQRCGAPAKMRDYRSRQGE